MTEMRFAQSVADLLSVQEMAAMSGYEFIDGIRAGLLPAPPIAKTLNFWLTEVGEGAVVFEGVPEFAAMNPIGTLHGGWFGAVLDSAMSCAVQTTLPQGMGYTTQQFGVNILRGIIPDGRAHYLATDETNCAPRDDRHNTDNVKSVLEAKRQPDTRTAELIYSNISDLATDELGNKRTILPSLNYELIKIMGAEVSS